MATLISEHVKHFKNSLAEKVENILSFDQASEALNEYSFKFMYINIYIYIYIYLPTRKRKQCVVSTLFQRDKFALCD